LHFNDIVINQCLLLGTLKTVKKKVESCEKMVQYIMESLNEGGSIVNDTKEGDHIIKGKM